MNNSKNHISSQTARRILLEAEQNKIPVEIYLKNIAEETSGSQLSVKKADIKYNFVKSREWVKDNARKYVGKWIVLDGEKLLGFGENPVPIVEKARREGVQIPFVQFIEDNSKPFMGGWL
jgi:Family of unknown function (DUF5678)